MGDVPCRGLGWLFFSEDEESVDRAKEICAACPCSADCLEGALGRREACGVWGGELLRLGEVLPGVPKRGRPRKVAA